MSEENNNAEVKLEKELDLHKDFTPPSYEEWKAKVEADLKGKPFDKLFTKTYENITLKPIYTKDDIKDLPHLKNTPGYNEYVRSTKAEGYLGKSWDIAQNIPYPLAEDFNEALKYDLERGQTAVVLPLDKATKLGLDADYAEKEFVGLGGVSISGLNSFERAVKDVDLTENPLYVDAGFSALPFLAVLNAYIKKNNVDASKFKGAVTADPYNYLVSEGSLPTDLDFLFDKMKISTEWAAENNLNIKTVGVSGLHYHNSGASAVQELAFAMATGAEYLSKLIERGLDVDTAAKSIRFTFGIGTFYFMEIAKLRAARVLWAKIVEAFGGSKEAGKINIHAVTSKFNQTKYDPYVNMLRTTTEAFSAVIGGIDSLQTNPFDELFGLPDNFSRRISRNVQLLLKEESHLDQLIDPAGGSFFIESLTDEVIKAAWKLFQDIDEKGGMLKVLEDGTVHALINEVKEARKKDLAKRKEVIVGSNMYANIKEEILKERNYDVEEVYKKRADYLQKFRVSQPAEKDAEILNKLESLLEAADKSTIDIATDLLLSGATLGELTKTIRAKNNNEVKINKLEEERAAEMFEALREASENYRKETGSLPKIFLANMGPLRQHKARADFSRGFFEVGGFDVIYPEGFENGEDAVNAAMESGAKIVCICSTDETYPEFVPAIAPKLKEKGITVILAGYPKDQIEAHKASGVDEFIFLGADVHQLLTKLLTNIGAIK